MYTLMKPAGGNMGGVSVHNSNQKQNSDQKSNQNPLIFSPIARNDIANPADDRLQAGAIPNGLRR